MDVLSILLMIAIALVVYFAPSYLGRNKPKAMRFSPEPLLGLDDHWLACGSGVVVVSRADEARFDQ
jgi:hypothetical protein